MPAHQPDEGLSWDDQRIKDLLCSPGRLLRDPEWAAWIAQRGGLAGLYAHLRSLPLAERERATLSALLDLPGAPAQRYARQLNIDSSTYFRYRVMLLKALRPHLNALSPQAGMPPSPLEPRLGQLPADPSSFIGRERELDEICALLERESVRLVTLAGSGGAGKTRLALRAARRLAPRFVDGAYFVPLAALAAPTLLPSTIASCLGLKELAGQPIADRLLRYLAPRQLLLALDNLEQLLAAAPWLGELLAAAPGLKLLATSRALLHLRGEHIVDVPALSLPPPDGELSAQQLLAYESIRLFVERAQAADQRFALSDQNAGAVSAICRRLDGLPLAIELAAARVRHLAPETILALLERPLAFLHSPAPDLPLRHQTLRGVFDWSYQQLSLPEQLLFRRLGIFKGGWSLPSALELCLPPGSGRLELAGWLGSLVDQSLLQTLAGPGETRYTMLETLREYALEQLAEHGELGPMRQAHALHYLALAEHCEPELAGDLHGRWLAQLERELDNLRGALEHLLGGGQAHEALRLAAALYHFWQIRGRRGEGLRWLQQALALSSGDPGYAAARVNALVCAGWLAYAGNQRDQALACFVEALEGARALGAQRCLGMALHGVATLTRDQGDLGQAQALFEQSLPLFEACGDQAHIGWTLQHLGFLALIQDQPQAMPLYERSLLHFRAAGHLWAIALVLTVLGGIYWNEGRAEQAVAMYQESLSLSERLGDDWSASRARNYLGRAALARGDDQQALDLQRASLHCYRALDDQWGVAICLDELGQVAAAQGQLDQARHSYLESLALYRQLASQTGQVICLRRLAALEAQLGAGPEPLELAARLYGAAQALAGDASIQSFNGLRVEPLAPPQHLLDALDQPALQLAWQSGLTAPLDHTLSFLIQHRDTAGYLL